MAVNLAIKAGGVWLIIVGLAIANGFVRETLLVPAIGQAAALPVSGMTLAVLVFLTACVAMPYFGRHSARTFVYIGLQWVLMTTLFEVIFGHYVAGKPWTAVLQVFNVLHGDLFIVVLLAALLSPYLAAKLRGLL